MKQVKRGSGNFADLGDKLTPETLKAFATVELAKADYNEDTPRILAFEEDTTGSFYRCVETSSTK